MDKGTLITTEGVELDRNPNMNQRSHGAGNTKGIGVAKNHLVKTRPW